MRVVLQRVSRAEVRIADRVTGRIGRGFLLLVGFTHTDGEASLAWMADKVVGLYLANAMVDQPIGLEETDDGIWAIYFSTVLLATFDERDYIIRG